MGGFLARAVSVLPNLPLDSAGWDELLMESIHRCKI
eukprot:COSAG05_NODE_19299_length_295_cov_0.265306_1_plen_35_part_01